MNNEEDKRLISDEEYKRIETAEILKRTEEKSKKLNLIVYAIFWFLYGLAVGAIIFKS